jgi:hypothetical protein
MLMYFTFQGMLVSVKTFGYKTYFQIAGASVILDSQGDFFYDISIHRMAVANKYQLMIRRSQLYLLRQVWAMEFGTNTGTGSGLAIGKGGI